MNINVAIDDLKNDLVKLINESGLPIGVIELICKDLYTTVQNQYIGFINSERMKDMQSPQEMISEVQTKADESQRSIEEAFNGQGS